MSAAELGWWWVVAMFGAGGLVVGMTFGFSLRDHLERRICGWLPGADDE